MEISDIIRLMQAVSDHGLTGFKLEEGNLKLSIKKEKEQTVTAAGTGFASQIAQAAGLTAETAVLPAAEYSLQAGTENRAGKTRNAEPDSSAPDSSAPDAAIASDKIVASPLVGIFYNSASPETEPFVKVGDAVRKGQTLGIIEAMKLMNEIECEFDGVVEAVLVGNENVVEYGQPLFRIQ